MKLGRAPTTWRTCIAAELYYLEEGSPATPASRNGPTLWFANRNPECLAEISTVAEATSMPNIVIKPHRSPPRVRVVVRFGCEQTGSQSRQYLGQAFHGNSRCPMLKKERAQARHQRRSPSAA